MLIFERSSFAFPGQGGYVELNSGLFDPYQG
jgi:hypothetical protein